MEDFCRETRVGVGKKNGASPVCSREQSLLIGVRFKLLYHSVGGKRKEGVV